MQEAELIEGRDSAWKDLSRTYAQAARGNAYVFVPDLSLNNVLGRDEVPELRKNPGVGTRNIKFVTAFPEHAHIPKSVNQFLSHDEVRAQVTMDHYDVDGPSKDVLKASKLPTNTPLPHPLAHKLDNISLPEPAQRTGQTGLRAL